MKKGKVWSIDGYGAHDDVENERTKINFHIMNSGRTISRNKFITLVAKITRGSKAWFYERTYLAGNDKQYLMPNDDNFIVFLREPASSINDVLLKFDLEGDLVWMRNDISESDKKMIFQKYGELKDG